MAVKTVRLVDFEGGNVRVEFDYDDVTNLMLALRQINNTGLQANPRAVETRLTFINPDGTPNLAKRFPTDGSFHRTAVGQTDSTVVPPAIAAQIPLTIVNLRGRLVVANISAESHFPVA